MRTKKLLALLLSFLMVFSLLTACAPAAAPAEAPAAPAATEAPAEVPAEPAAEPKTGSQLVVKSTNIYPAAFGELLDGGVVIDGDRITAVVPAAELDKYIGDNTQVLDYGDQLVMPGLVDGHTHVEVAEAVVGVDLLGVDSQEAAAKMVADYMTAHPDDDFITGTRWYASVWGGADPDKSYLDAVAPDIPVVLADMDGHTNWNNSKALELAGIDKDFAATFNKENGAELIVVDANGEPTGYLKEAAARLTGTLTPAYTTEDVKTCIDVWSTYGVTTVSDMGVKMTADDLSYQQWKELEDAGTLQVRIAVSIDSTAPEEEIAKAKEAMHSDMLWLGALKTFMDGVGSTYTASMLTPYEGTTETGGDPYCTAEQVRDIVIKARNDGLGAHFHCCGNRAVRTCLDGIQMAKEAGADVNNLVSIEHWDTVHPDDLNRAAELGISCNVTPDFLAPTEKWADNPYLIVYDDEVDAQLWRYGSLYKSGANVTFGTDTYWSSYNPMVQLYRALERKTNDGMPEGGYEPEEKFTLEEALQCYTINSAKSIGADDRVGSLEPGKYADLIVLDTNIIKATSEEILNTKVLVTMLGGKIVYELN